MEFTMNSFEVELEINKITEKEIKRQMKINPSRKDYKILQQKIALKRL